MSSPQAPVEGRRAGYAGPHDCLPPPVTGGGPAAGHAPRAALQPDPALAALAGMLGAATPPPRGPSTLQQLTTQLSTMLAAIGSRLAATPDPAGAASITHGPRDAPEVAPVPRQPVPPPPLGPVLSLDPALGLIAVPVDATNRGSEGGVAGPDVRGTLEDARWTPSAWLPVTGSLMVHARRRIGSVADRIDALLAEIGMTRVQLLLLLAVGPVAVAFAIDVVASLLAER